MTDNSRVISTSEELRAFAAEVANGTFFSTHHPEEQRALASCLPPLGQRIVFHFPLTIIHRDKPDFLLVFQDRRISVEVVKFLSSARAHATATARRLGIGFIPTRYDFGSPTRTREQMEQSLVAPSVGLTDWRPIFDRQYVEEILRLVQEKKQKVLIESSVDAAEHWLLIEDEHDMSDLQIDYVIRASLDGLQSHWASQPHFARIILLSRPLLVDMNQADPAHTNI